MHRNMHRAIQPPQGVTTFLIALALLLAALPLSTTAAYSEESGSVELLEYAGYPDVEPTDWYVISGDFDYSIEHGIITGYDNGRYGPYDDITRGQVATILWRIADEPLSQSKAFNDVNYDEYYGPAIRWARAEGVINGYTGTNDFGPDTPVTREQLATMLSNYASKIAGLDVSSDLAALEAIDGANEVSDWALEAMGWAVDNGILSGDMSSGTAQVNPQGTAQRCMAVKMMSVLHRDILDLGNTPGPDDPQKPSDPDTPDPDTPDNPSEPAPDGMDFNDDAVVIDGNEYQPIGDNSALIDADTAADIEAGDVIILSPTDDYPSGDAIKVESLTPSGENVSVSGAQPEFSEVFDALSISGSTSTVIEFELEPGVEMVDEDGSISTLATVDDKFELVDKTFKIGKYGTVDLTSSVNYHVDYFLLFMNELDVSINAKAKFSWDYETHIDKTIKIGKATFATSVPGVTIDAVFSVVAAADGEAHLAVTASATAGVSYDHGDWDTEFKRSLDYEASFGGHVKLGVEPSVAIDVLSLPVVDAAAEVSGNIDGELNQRSADFVCCDLSAWIYVGISVGEGDSLANDLGLSKTFDLVTKKNSPKWALHTENGEIVPACTWNNQPAEPGDPGDPDNPGDPDVDTTPADGFVYTDVTNGIRIVDYLGAETDIVIPVTIDGKDVVEVGFYSNPNTGGQSSMLGTVKSISFAPGSKVQSFGYGHEGGATVKNPYVLDRLDARNAELISDIDICDGGNLKSIDVRGLTALTRLQYSALPTQGIASGLLTEVKLENNSALEYLFVRAGIDYTIDPDRSVAINPSQAPAISVLGLNMCGIKSLDVSTNRELVDLDCGWNPMASLDLSHNTKLEHLVRPNETCSIIPPEGKDLSDIVS